MSYPAPILNLNFANTKQLVHPAVAFSRGSTGAYFDGNGILRYANNSVPRFDHDPLTGICKGLLLEPAVTFLDTYSEQFDNAAWTKSSATITANAAIAPDGTTTADKLVGSSGSSRKYITRNWSGLTTSANEVGDIYIKAAEAIWVCFTVSLVESGYIRKYINVSTGAVGSTIVNGGASLVKIEVSSLTGGWYKVSLSISATTNTNASFTLDLCDADNTLSYTGDGASGLYIWGAKLYAGTGPTSYLPTVASGVTRAADVCSVGLTNLTRNGSPLWTGTEGTIVVDFRFNNTSSSNQWILHIDDGTLSNRVGMLVWGGGPIVESYVTKSGANVFAPTGRPVTISENHKIAFSFKTSNYSSCVDGGAIVTQDTGVLPTGLATMRIGAAISSGQLGGHIRSVQLYNRRIADSYLPALSAL